MATTTFEVDIDVNYKSVEDLNKELETLKKEFEGVAIGSERFKQLGNEIKKTESKLKDIDLQFEALDKEQRATALVDTFNGLTGAVGAVSSAFIAFGASSEEIENAEKKLLGIIGVVSGLRDVSNATVAATKLFGPTFETLGTSIKTAFTKGTTAAKAFKISLASLGIGLLIIAVDQLIANWDKFTEILGFSTDKQAELNKKIEEAEAAVVGQTYALESYNAIVQDTTRSEDERTAALEMMNKQGVATEDIDLSNAESLQLLNERTAQSITLIMARAKASAAAAILEDALKKQLEAQNMTLEEAGTWWDNSLMWLGKNTGGMMGLQIGIQGVTGAAKEQREAISEANEDVARATELYQSTLNELIAAEGQNVTVQKTVRENLERRAKTETAVKKAIEDRAKVEENAYNIAKQALLDLEVLRAAESEKEIVQIRQNYAERLNALKIFFGEESTEYKNLMELMNAEIAAVRKQQADQAAADTKDLLGRINEAVAVSTQQQRDLELENTTMFYNDLIAEAQKNGIDTYDLEQAKLEKLKQLRESYAAEDEAGRNEDIAKEKAYRQQLSDLAIDSALSLISSLKELNSIYDKDSEAAAKKAFQRQKSLNMVETIISTYSAAQKAYASQFTPIPTPDSPVRGQIAAAVAIAGGLAKLAVISKQQFQTSGTPSGGGLPRTTGGGGTIPTSMGGGFVPGAPTTPQLTPPGGGPGINQMPLRAYVLAGDVTSAQSADARLQQRRTL